MTRLRIFLIATMTLVLGLTSSPAVATGTAALSKWLFETARDLPRSHAPGESMTEELLRLERITVAYAGAVVPYADGKGWTGSELAMAVLILIVEESQLDQRIHAGTGHPVWHEDRGRSKCLGQIQASRLIPAELWRTLTGLDEESTTRCAEATVAVWVSQAKQCGVWYGRRASREAVAETFMAYGSGGKCAPDDRAYERADKWLARMQKRPDRSPVKGFRRVMPSELTEEARKEAESFLESEEFSVGALRRLNDWAFRGERHADGKVGVSVFREDK
jgi:hypothetical protein